MVNFFCAESSRQAGENLIGCASNYDTYVLVECPTPWAAYEFDSKSVPANLRVLEKEVHEHLDANFLLIYNESLKQDYTRVLILWKNEELSKGYSKQEFHVPDINQVAPLVRDYLAGQPSAAPVESPSRDILVCTHGSHDKCCARYGYPFYRQALATVSDLSLNHVRIWQASHIGGHRFAPTAIDFPEGRYYGYLDQASFASILTRTGDIECLKNVYRGWAILPGPAQVLERELILMHGWDWFKYKVAGQIIDQNEDESYNCIELTFETPDGDWHGYRAEVVANESKTLYLKGSCNSEKEFPFPQYAVENIVKIQK